MINQRTAITSALAAISAPAIVRAQSLRGTLSLMANAGIFQDNYTKAVVDPFQQAFPDVKITYSPGGTSAQMLGCMRSQKQVPQIDVAIMDVTTSTIANAESLFEKLPADRVPALAELFPEARAAGEDFGPAVTFDRAWRSD